MADRNEDIAKHPFIAEAARLNMPELPEDATAEDIEKHEKAIAERGVQYAALSRNESAGDVSEEILRDQRSGVWTAELLNHEYGRHSTASMGGNFLDIFKTLWATFISFGAHNGRAAASEIHYEQALKDMYAPKVGSPIVTAKPQTKGLDGQKVQEEFVNASVDSAKRDTVSLTPEIKPGT